MEEDQIRLSGITYVQNRMPLCVVRYGSYKTSLQKVSYRILYYSYTKFLYIPISHLLLYCLLVQLLKN